MADETRGKAYHEKVAEEVIAALEKGTAPWVKPWEPGQIPESPKNAVTGRPYRGGNRVFLSLAQPDEDPRWCTYRQAQEAGAQVREGSKGTRITYYQFDELRLVKDAAGNPALNNDGEKEYEKVRLERPKMFSAVMFHASQIDGLPPYEKAPAKPEWERHQEAEKLIEASGVPIKHELRDVAFYLARKDEIHMPERDLFPTADAYYAVALHEVGHSTGHESRLGRDLSHPFGSETYAREELRAELASYMLGSELGIGHDPGQHHAYVGMWVENLKNDPYELFRAARDAQDICDYVQGRYQERTVEQVTEQGKEQGARGAQEKTWLAVPYEEKDAAKNLGARWDGKAKSWFAPVGVDVSRLEKWLPENQPGRQEPPRDPAAQFAEVLEGAGLRLEGLPVMDGEIHRVPVEGGKPGSRDGAYVGHADGLPAGFYQNYKTGERSKWRASLDGIDPSKVAEVRAETEAKRQARQEERRAGQEQAAEALWKDMAKMPEASWEHPYLASKGVTNGVATPDIKVDAKGNLVVPVHDGEGNLLSAQRIGGSGFKSFAEGCRVTGGRYLIGGAFNLEKQGQDVPILVGTGFGTAACVHQATQRSVVVAFQDNNLKSVVMDIHRRFPERPIAILGDDDRHLPSQGLPNSGREAAEEAAKAVGGVAIFPRFKANEKGREFTDFADIARLRSTGLEAVKRQVEQPLAQFLDKRRQDRGQAPEDGKGQTVDKGRATPKKEQARTRQRAPRSRDRGMEPVSL